MGRPCASVFNYSGLTVKSNTNVHGQNCNVVVSHRMWLWKSVILQQLFMSRIDNVHLLSNVVYFIIEATDRIVESTSFVEGYAPKSGSHTRRRSTAREPHR